MYLALEGIDTAGKSTQIALLQEHFTDAHFTKEPGSTAFGAVAREILLHNPPQSSVAEMLLFCADRAEHIAMQIQPLLNQNEQPLIVSDRSLLSGIAYASASQCIEFDTIITINKIATQNILPAVAIMLELDRPTLTNRLSAKKNDAIEERGIDYLLRVQTAIKQAAVALDIELICIDASKTISAISEQIIRVIKERQ